ncbi:MAG: recombination mediator RecR [Oscillospiraceae bacterium]|nr:recombination mediator RecR [Oscillospiraceae bacterium]
MANKSIPALEKLIDKFASLPGIGRKSAARLAYWVLALDKAEADDFAKAITDAHAHVHQCPVCFNLTDSETCSICGDPTRDRSIICVVESPRDVSAFEAARDKGYFDKSHDYRGLYHVLHGLISPMDDIGPEQLHIRELVVRAANDEVKEVIMAMNPTIEGDSTAIYISKLLKPLGVRVTRIAYGLPVGGNLEYADDTTLYRALEGRNEI